jgi:hypothetical protein
MGVPGTDHDRGERMHCTGEVFYVDPNFPGISDQRDGTSPTSPLRTVATALTKVQPQRGDTIVVMMNDYWVYAPGGEGVSTDYITPISESITIPYTASGVRIIGVSNGTLGVMWQPAANLGTCITCHAIDVTIEGFIFTSGDFAACNGIYAEWNGATLFGENLTVRHCSFDDTVQSAIQLEYSWYCDIHSNKFWQCANFGVEVDTGGSGVAFCAIHDNLFHDVGAAISLLGGSDNNEVYNNHLYNRTAITGGAAANVFINTTGGDFNLVHHNTMSCDPGPGNGDYSDTCSPGGSVPETDAWIENYLPAGPTTGAP